MLDQLTNTGRLDFVRDGASHFPEAALASLPGIEAALADLPRDRAGLRLIGAEALWPYFAPDGKIGRCAASVLGDACRPVRAVLFDKSSATNWSLSWHQDRTICVEERLEVAGFGPWTVKKGIVHVEPPFELLARMVTLRIHLDSVPDANAPLLVALGSHRLGRIVEGNIQAVVARCQTLSCLARAGDVWLYATPILHASAPASKPSRRRVLQVDYAAEDLTGGLCWAGI